MISRDRLETEIRELEEAPVTLRNCEQLVMLKALYNMYYIEDIQPKAEMQSYSGDTPTALPTVPQVSDSEFMQAISGVDSVGAWELMDELMGTLSVLDARLYKQVMGRISEIKR